MNYLPGSSKKQKFIFVIGLTLTLTGVVILNINHDQLTASSLIPFLAGCWIATKGVKIQQRREGNQSQGKKHPGFKAAVIQWIADYLKRKRERHATIQDIAKGLILEKDDQTRAGFSSDGAVATNALHMKKGATPKHHPRHSRGNR